MRKTFSLIGCSETISYNRLKTSIDKLLKKQGAKMNVLLHPDEYFKDFNIMVEKYAKKRDIKVFYIPEYVDPVERDKYLITKTHKIVALYLHNNKKIINMIRGIDFPKHIGYILYYDKELSIFEEDNKITNIVSEIVGEELTLSQNLYSERVYGLINPQTKNISISLQFLDKNSLSYLLNVSKKDDTNDYWCVLHKINRQLGHESFAFPIGRLVRKDKIELILKE